MPDLLQTIYAQLNSDRLANNLTTLFCETLRWGRPTLRPRMIAVGQPVGQNLNLVPVAQISGLPVFRVDWPSEKPPTLLARRAVHKAITPLHTEHMLCYVMQDGRRAWFVRGRKRTEDRIEFRSLPYEVGTLARTTIERLGELAFSLDELGLLGEPSISIVTDKLDRAFDVEKVTKEFYSEIANWYFWARTHWADGKLKLPADVADEAAASRFLIRLLTRLIFCWFLRQKENPQTKKGLLPHELFEERDIRNLIKDASPEACTYYPAVLQNLFFATLNTEMDQPKQKPNRRFIDEGDGQRSDDHMIHTLWRHEKLLQNPDAFAALLRIVPFLNGGLFECLDDRVQRGKSAFTEEVRIDGFSNDFKQSPKLPNYLFYGQDQTANLSGAYGDSSRQRERVRPLLAILQRYNFTLTENTPLDQEVALDPELLGHVFENLLAAYNPETGTVARKATGSFYTPRVVVDWMVDQALLSYLGSKLTSSGKKPKDANNNDCLRHLLSWEESASEFNRQETDTLIDSIDHLKVLDPACGSGADMTPFIRAA
jgi:hypothetical protein